MSEAVDLAPLKAACATRSPDRFWALARTIEQLAGRIALDPRDAQETLAELSRLALEVLADPTLTLSENDYATLLALEDMLAVLFAASHGPCVDPLEGRAPDPRRRLLSLDGPGALDLDRLRRDWGELALLALAAALSAGVVLTPEGAARRDGLLEAAAEARAIGDIPAKLSSIGTVASAWMLCSYAATPRKHEVKRLFNAAYRRLLAQMGMADPPLAPRRPKARPCLVFCAEVINSTHVQFRYYAQYLRQLRARFRLVLVARDREVDATVAALFDEVRPFSQDAGGGHLGQIAQAIVDAQPDVLLWPSLGMAHWGPLIANLRLAPIQATAIGHPAPTHIAAMDYMLMEEGFVDDPADFGERLILLPDAALRLERPSGYRPVAPQIRPVAETVRIAAPCNMLKLNPAFVGVMARLRARASRPVEFHLFPNAPGLKTAAFEAWHGAALGGPVIYPRLSPQEYLERLNDCDMALSPFPFGGFHSVVDCLGQGLPVVAMSAAGNPVQTDRMLLRLLGQPDWLVATSEDEYEAAALRIVEDDALRAALSEQALAADLDRRLFAEPQAPVRTEVADALWAVYQHHETLMSSQAKAWRLSDLKAL